MTDPVTGRPIVAELGRPETDEERAARVAENRRKRRANQSSTNLLLSIGASLLIVLFLVVVTVREDPTPESIDYRATAEQAEAGVGMPVVAPDLPEGWYANRADLGSHGSVQEWYVGLITTDDRFIGVLQGFDANPTWLDQVLRQPSSEGESVEIGGTAWTLYDRREAEGVGNRGYALVTETAGSTLVLYGTASESEFSQLAAAVAAELDDADR
ncbi:hypothetical protein GCM10009792_01300 [Microcella alkalica]|uniref:DUF4245 domain-containing protein n=1 Tax=Microcella alkalica TaxID=355930 RepID=A0A839E7X9_9MICO|nr:DUF4245 domain-containing protein [Microcella alkalica]MBA8847870.1 hypothetical protein [Microcella alkalica]